MGGGDARRARGHGVLGDDHVLVLSGAVVVQPGVVDLATVLPHQVDVAVGGGRHVSDLVGRGREEVDRLASGDAVLIDLPVPCTGRGSEGHMDVSFMIGGEGLVFRMGGDVGGDGDLVDENPPVLVVLAVDYILALVLVVLMDDVDVVVDGVDRHRRHVGSGAVHIAHVDLGR